MRVTDEFGVVLWDGPTLHTMYECRNPNCVRHGIAYQIREKATGGAIIGSAAICPECGHPRAPIPSSTVAAD